MQQKQDGIGAKYKVMYLGSKDKIILCQKLVACQLEMTEEEKEMSVSLDHRITVSC